MSERPVYHLTEQEWQADVRHRKHCSDRLCDHRAHHYARDHADGRVLVGGIPVDANGWPIQPPPQ